MSSQDPFGMLQSFGGITFPNPSSPITEFTIEFLTNFTPLPDAPFPIDNYGLSAAPIRESSATWVYLFLTTVGSPTPYQNIEGQWRTFKTALLATNGDGTSPQASTLVVKDASGTNRSATARLTKATLSLVAGKNTQWFTCPLTFMLLSDWT